MRGRVEYASNRTRLAARGGEGGVWGGREAGVAWVYKRPHWLLHARAQKRPVPWRLGWAPSVLFPLCLTILKAESTHTFHSATQHWNRRHRTVEHIINFILVHKFAWYNLCNTLSLTTSYTNKTFHTVRSQCKFDTMIHQFRVTFQTIQYYFVQFTGTQCWSGDLLRVIEYRYMWNF